MLRAQPRRRRELQARARRRAVAERPSASRPRSLRLAPERRRSARSAARACMRRAIGRDLAQRAPVAFVAGSARAPARALHREAEPVAPGRRRSRRRDRTVSPQQPRRRKSHVAGQSRRASRAAPSCGRMLFCRSKPAQEASADPDGRHCARRRSAEPSSSSSRSAAAASCCPPQPGTKPGRPSSVIEQWTSHSCRPAAREESVAPAHDDAGTRGATPSSRACATARRRTHRQDQLLEAPPPCVLLAPRRRSRRPQRGVAMSPRAAPPCALAPRRLRLRHRRGAKRSGQRRRAASHSRSRRRTASSPRGSRR